MAKTLFEKIWDEHVVATEPDCPSVLYIDLQLIHEVTSPQAFKGLRDRGLKVRRPDRTVATVDHIVPTHDPKIGVLDPQAKNLIAEMTRGCSENGITFHGIGSPNQGIVHVIGPELGLTLPGMTIVCGDSHTSTHGAFGALAFGIGTSEVEMVLATQTLLQRKPKTMEVRVDGTLHKGVAAKDIILALIAKIGTGGGTGHCLEYRGAAVRALNMEERMTVCNMSIEAGARAGMIAPDRTTFDYLRGRRFAPNGEAFDAAIENWKSLASDEGATFDREMSIDVASLAPQVSWGTNPGMVADVDGTIPDPDLITDSNANKALRRALEYMNLVPHTPIHEIELDRVFIGSCTNSRIEDLREAARVIKGRQVSPSVRAMVVPGSHQVKTQAEDEGLDKLFIAAGFEWREPGCSMCLGMNPDILNPGERCASTSNRNFEGRQGRGGRTHLGSPAMAAAAAIAGHFVDVRNWIED